MNFVRIYFCILYLIDFTFGFLEKGLWKFEIYQREPFIAISKIVKANSNIYVKIKCTNYNIDLNVKWILKRSPCADEFSFLYFKNDVITTYFNYPNLKPLQFYYKNFEYQTSLSYKNPQFKKCDNYMYSLQDESHEQHYIVTNNVTVIKSKNSDDNMHSIISTNLASNNQIFGENTPTYSEMKKTKNVNKRSPIKPQKFGNNRFRVAQTWTEGNYLFIMKFEFKDDVDTLPNISFGQVVIEVKNPENSYLSIQDWPLLPFFAIMCVIYLFYLLLWSFWCIKYRKELLRIQYCIAGVILLGFIEKSAFLGEYNSMDKRGTSIYGALVFAEFISTFKRSLSRILIITASVGYGIVKPRLGETMKRIILVGFLYFAFAFTESIIRISRNHATPNTISIIATIVVSVLEALISWWIFSGLVNTLRILKLRQNIVKLRMYRHFTNVLVVCVIASTCFMLWSLKEHKFVTCIQNYRQLWLDEAFWHLLFSTILFAMIILWRPSANNQRYAFTPLLDDSKYADDDYGDNVVVASDSSGDEGPEDVLYNARGIIKMRSVKGYPEDKRPLVTRTSKNDTSTTEADLKWIEDNIPPSIADTALPNLVDSDEEENIRRFEIGKMQ